jgi:hypothetical protein
VTDAPLIHDVDVDIVATRQKAISQRG